ncbi:transposase [Micromonospora sp. NPDC085948]|uniref:IS701 family transposase n=1 Tax=Micromonospora sp. NPDC085948 TaxID=3155293 RepID=UPI003445159F
MVRAGRSTAVIRSPVPAWTPHDQPAAVTRASRGFHQERPIYQGPSWTTPAGLNICRQSIMSGSAPSESLSPASSREMRLRQPPLPQRRCCQHLDHPRCALQAHCVRRWMPRGGRMRLHDDVTDLCTDILAGLPRSDQRRRGMEYIRGLLLTRGRKSIRNIAAISAEPAAEQALHHFVSDSTWDWMPVRQALTRHVTRVANVSAWVLHPTLIRKAGTHSVGVGRKYSPGLGQSLNAQHAVGLWAATPDFVAPVNWRLHLNEDWLADEHRRRRAAIPDDMVAQSLGACTVETYLELGVAADDLVLVDAREMEAGMVVRRLRASGAPVLIRIPAGLRLVASGRSAAECAGDLAAAARHSRRPVFGLTANPPVLAGTVAVRLPSTRAHDPLLMVELSAPGGSGPGQLWLTSRGDVGLADLVRLTSLVPRVGHDLEMTGDRVGLRAFTGRSYRGWHRHVTLASAAHTVLAARGCAEPALRRTS